MLVEEILKRSVALRDISVFAFAAISPERPCMYAPSLAALNASIPDAKNAPIIPVKTSPHPPEAIPGLPDELI